MRRKYQKMRQGGGCGGQVGDAQLQEDNNRCVGTYSAIAYVSIVYAANSYPYGMAVNNTHA